MLRNKFHVVGEDSLKIPCHTHFGKDILDNMLKQQNQAALINADNGETLTFRQLAQRSIDIALSLAHIGVKKGDVVSILSEKRMDIMPTIIGIACAGATLSAMDVTYGEAPLMHRVKIAQPKAIFCSPIAYDLHKKSLDSVGCINNYIIYGEENKDGAILFKDFLTETADPSEFLPVSVDGWKDLLFILSSSGTTGLPKGVPWTHFSFLINTSSMHHEGWRDMTTFITREWYYTYGLLYTLSALHAGSTVIYSVRNELDDLLQAIEKYKVQLVQCTPSLLTSLIKSSNVDKYDVTSIQVFISASTPVLEQQLISLKERFPNVKGVYQMYGMTEAGSICHDAIAPQGVKLGSVGTPSQGFTVKVVDLETRKLLGPRQRGEIYYKAPCLMTGYLGVDSKSHLDSEGFFQSGDVGWYDEDGYFYIVERLKEMIKFNDYAIAPAELESVLLCHPAVREAGVGMSGAVPAAAVVLREGETVGAVELLNYLNSKVSSSKMCVARLVFIEALPRGAGEKLDRKALAQILKNIETDTLKA